MASKDLYSNLLVSNSTVNTVFTNNSCIDSKISFNDDDVVFKVGDKQFKISNIIDKLNAIEERLYIIQKLDPTDQHNLKEAYREYKFVEKLITGDKNENS
jgi:hypothetical protein